MKKFRLKPLGELRQKFSMNWFLIGLVMTLCVSACSNDDDENLAPTFPEKQTIECDANATKELTFEANADWQLTTSAAWCRFVVDGKEEYSLSGGAGKQTVTVKITDEAQKPDGKSIAQITLMMGLQKAVIADVARNAKDLFLKVYDMEGNEIQEIEVGYNAYKPFTVKANFRFAATNRPEWLDIQSGVLVGVSNKEVKSGVQVINDAKFFKYIQDGELTFADEKGLYSKPIKVVYKGMNPNEIKITRPTQLAWNWTVSLDGKTFNQDGVSSPSGGTTGGSTFMYGIPYTVSALNDEFVPVYVEDWNGTYYADADSWIELKGEKGNMRLTVKPTAAERVGYVFVFPKSEYDKIKNNLEANIFPNGEIDYTYEQNNLLIQFTQKESKKEENTKAFKITYLDINDNWTTKELSCTKVTDIGVTSEFGIEEVYTMVLPQQAMNMPGDRINFSVEPLLEGEFTIFEYTDQEEPSSFCEGSENGIFVSIPVDGLESDLRIIFKQNSMNKKVLIVTPN